MFERRCLVRRIVESESHAKTNAHFLENVISSCIHCHRKAEFGNIPETELRAALGVAKPSKKFVPTDRLASLRAIEYYLLTRTESESEGDVRAV